MKNKYILITLVVLAIILFLLVSSFVGDVRRLRDNGVLVYHNPLHYLYQAGKPATLSDVNFIAGWMTFNYLNKIFNLPMDYLKTTLSVSNKDYPNVTISKTASQQKILTSTYLASVKKAVSNYLIQNIPPQ